MNAKGILLSMLAGCTLALGAADQDRSGSWTYWTMKDAMKILNDSPWGQTQTTTDISEMMYSPTNRGSGSGALNQAISLNYRIRFLSARPIREALLRMLQLDPSRSTPAEIDRAQIFVDQAFEKEIVIAVNYDSRDPRYSQEAFAYFNGQITSTLKNDTYLELSTGGRMFLREYQPPSEDGLGAKYIFDRFLGDKPFITTDAEYVRFESGTLNMRFKIADFLYHGTLEY